MTTVYDDSYVIKALTRGGIYLTRKMASAKTMSTMIVATRLLFILVLFALSSSSSSSSSSSTSSSSSFSFISSTEKRRLRDQTVSMFRHAYDSYMKYAFPADELMPLSCRGRFRGSEPSRGNDDDALGNFTLTLVDSLDTLALIEDVGDGGEFERAVKLVADNLHFDIDVVVSVFETNIRMLGGLLGGHSMAVATKQRNPNRLLWYDGQLLRLAEELGRRLLPAFNSTTGIPFSRINLRHGIDKNNRETCTACAGTMILEFAALSRFSGNPVFETKARHAMEQLWNFRHRETDLVGTVINVESGEWQRRDSGIGAGIDSYYEYLFKGYILLSDESYLDRFNAHYKSIQKYVRKGPLWVDVHMHKPTTSAKNFMDALAAYWPGLQVLKGDLTSAIETHEMLYQVMQRHGGFLPEAFTTDFRVHWGQSPLRPEFIESTYFLYKATGDEHYLKVGKAVLDSIEALARVPCGYAAIKDVRTGKHEDRMDSFVLAELFKYLYLLFSEQEDLPINVDDYVFTTEAHLLPLSIGSPSKEGIGGGNEGSGCASNPPPAFKSSPPPLIKPDIDDAEDDDDATCPAHPQLKMRFPGMTQEIRKNLENLVEDACPSLDAAAAAGKPALRASEFQAGNKDHVAALERMGIRLVTMKDGRVQLLQTTAQASSVEDAREGMLFMQEMIELSKNAAVQDEPQSRVVRYSDSEDDEHEGGCEERTAKKAAEMTELLAGPAQFGYDLTTRPPVRAPLVIVKPFNGCTIDSDDDLRGKIAVMQRGDCMFVVKARAVEKLGAIGGVVIDNNDESSAASSPIFAMSGDGSDDVGIPLVFLFDLEGRKLLNAHWKRPGMKVTLADAKNPMDPVSTVPTRHNNAANSGSAVPALNVGETKSTTTTTKPSTMEEFKVVEASDKEEDSIAANNNDSNNNNIEVKHSLPVTKDYLDVFQVLDGSKEIVHVGNDRLKLVVRSTEELDLQNWVFHPSIRVVESSRTRRGDDGGGDNLNTKRTENNRRKMYIYLDCDVPSSPSPSSSPDPSSSPSSFSSPLKSPPWEDLRASILSVLESTTNWGESLLEVFNDDVVDPSAATSVDNDDDDEPLESEEDRRAEMLETLTFIAFRALERSSGKASRLRLSDERMRSFNRLSRHLRVVDESLVERIDGDNHGDEVLNADVGDAFSYSSTSSSSLPSSSSSSPSSLHPEDTLPVANAQTSHNTYELDSTDTLVTLDSEESSITHSTDSSSSSASSSSEATERWNSLKQRSSKDEELRDLLDEVENFLQDPELKRYVDASLELQKDKEAVDDVVEELEGEDEEVDEVDFKDGDED